MTNKAIFSRLIDTGSIQNTVNLASYGTTLTVCNENTEAATLNPLDPWNAKLTTGGNYDNIRIIAVPDNYIFAEFYWVWPDTTIATSAPSGRVFGLIPPPGGGTRVWPEDIDSTNYQVLRTGIASTQEDFWIPLTESGGGLTPLNFAVTSAAEHTLGGAPFSMSLPVNFPLVGAKAILVTISTAAVAPWTGNGMILVRFTG